MTEWRIVFFTMAAFLFFSIIFFTVFGEGKRFKNMLYVIVYNYYILLLCDCYYTAEPLEWAKPTAVSSTAGMGKVTPVTKVVTSAEDTVETSTV